MDVVGEDSIGQVEDEVTRELCVGGRVQVQDLTTAAAEFEADVQLVADVLEGKRSQGISETITQPRCVHMRSITIEPL